MAVPAILRRLAEIVAGPPAASPGLIAAGARPAPDRDVLDDPDRDALSLDGDALTPREDVLSVEHDRINAG